MGQNRPLVGGFIGNSAIQTSDYVHLCGIHEHDGDVVLDGVDTAALAAFQALAVGIQDDGLFADGADQQVEQILGNHGRPILA